MARFSSDGTQLVELSGASVASDGTALVRLSGSSALEGGHYTLTNAGTAATLSAAMIAQNSVDIPDDATGALITVEDAGVRFRWDGTNPTTSVGFFVDSGGTLLLDNRDDVTRLALISADGSSTATLQIAFTGA